MSESLAALVAEWRPDESWAEMVAWAYDDVVAGVDDAQRANGWAQAAMCFGDMHAVAACVLICVYGSERYPDLRRRFGAHLKLCLMDMRMDAAELQRWCKRELMPFGGDLETAALACLRLGATRLGIIHGPAEATIHDLADGAIWTRV